MIASNTCWDIAQNGGSMQQPFELLLVYERMRNREREASEARLAQQMSKQQNPKREWLRELATRLAHLQLSHQ